MDIKHPAAKSWAFYLLFLCWPLTDYCLVGALCGIWLELGTFLQNINPEIMLFYETIAQLDFIFYLYLQFGVVIVSLLNETRALTILLQE